MTQGLEVFDASGNSIIDVTTRITRYLATVRLAYNDFGLHSFIHAGFLTGTPFFLVDNQNNATSSVIAKTCLVTWVDIQITGDTCTYQQKYAAGASASNVRTGTDSNTKDLIIHFGVY